MRMVSGFVAMGLALMAAGSMALGQQPLPDAFEGRFRGTLVDSGGEFTVIISRTSSGFTVAWPPRIIARFEPAGHPCVFRTGEETQVLEGNPVYWARLEKENLVVYAAQIGKLGGYDIANFVYTPSDDGLDLVIRRIVTGAVPQISSGKLERYGG